jgi:formylglycine-generating enzyme required for sulfatase activity
MTTIGTSSAEPPPGLRPGADPRIQTLLAALRQRGFVLTLEDHRRLALVFPPERELSRAQTRAALCALLAKDEAQRRTLQRLFNQLFPPEPEAEIRTALPPRPDRARALAPTPRREGKRPAVAARAPKQPFWSRRNAVLLGGTALSLAISLAVILFAARGYLAEPQPTERIAPKPPTDGPERPDPLAPPSDPVELFHTWVPILEVDPAAALARLGPPLALFLGPALGLAWLWQRARDRARLDFRIPPLAADGVDDFHWPAPRGEPPPLLDGRARREMIWGVTRYQSEHFLPHLDIARTVAASARAGLPEIRFARASEARQVWLWIDVTSDDPAPGRLGAEIGRTLARSGLAVHIGRFRGVPHRIRLDTGEALEPEDLEAETRQASLAVLTDGAALARALESPEERPTVLRRLRDLREWPRLCLVDFTDGEYNLERLARHHGLACIAPRDLPYWLAERPPAADGTEAADAQLETWLWAACCALPQRPVTEEQALALHETLALEGAARYGAVRARGLGASSGLAFSAGQRQVLLAELADRACKDPEIRLALDRALDFWALTLEQVDRHMARDATLAGEWRHSEGQHRRHIEAWLLGLWRAPEKAARKLYDLFQLEPLQGEIRAGLARYAARGLERQEGDGRIFLPWSWGALDAQTRGRLLRMGFAGARHVRATADLRTRTLLGALAGAAAAGLLSTALRLADARPVYQYDAAVYESPLFHDVLTLDAEHRGRAYFASRKVLASIPIPPHAAVRVHWCWSGLEPKRAAPACRKLYERDNPHRRNVLEQGQSLLLRAGSRAEPVRACAPGWPELSVAVIEAKTEDMPARRLALRLLDSGSADLALLGPDSFGQAPELARRWAFVVDSQWLFFAAASSEPQVPALGRHRALIRGDFQAIAEKLDFEGARPAAEALGSVARGQALAGSPRVWGGPEVVSDPSGIDFVRLCPGTFTMGSRKDDPLADDDEHPAHAVILEGFAIARTETTQAQYAALTGETAGKGGDLPVTLVTWYQARDACRGIDAELPSEAQWEYAARAGAQTPWFWGAEQADAERYAWFSENAGYEAHPVGERQPNPWGVYDMSGNAYEWVRDCYEGDAYGRGGAHPVASPLEDPGTCGRRVLRGGSFGDEPRVLRSALRDWYDPQGRSGVIGFRCVRGSGRPLDH